MLDFSTPNQLQPRSALPNSAAKLAAGGPFRIAFIGGSITQAKNGWRTQTLAALASKFPNAQLLETQAAIGGTESIFGVFRLREHVLIHHPDLVFVEFAVNDEWVAPPEIEKSMEGIVRQIRKANPLTEIVFIYTITHVGLNALQQNKVTPSVQAHERVAHHYHIPSIYFGLEIARHVNAGKLTVKAPLPKTDAETAAQLQTPVFSRDGVHPLPDTGHKIYTEVALRSLTQLLQPRPVAPYPLLPPLHSDNYENATTLPLDAPGIHLSPGWRKMNPTEPVPQPFLEFLPTLFTTNRPGETIRFQFRGTYVGLIDIMGPDTHHYDLQIDNLPPRKFSRFDAYCSFYRIASMPIANGLPDTLHTVTLTFSPDPIDKAAVMAKANKPLLPEMNAPPALYPSRILLLGEIVNP